jgi:hypothetical protein
MSKDWIGNSHSIYSTIGASNHTNHVRAELDYYATDPESVKRLLEVEKFSNDVWEPACGEGHISNVLKEYGYKVYSTDIVNRGINDDTFDFLIHNTEQKDCDIVTNPPYKSAKAFVEKSLDSITSGHKVAMFLKLTFLEGQARITLFEKYPPKYIYVFSDRQKCAMNGDFDNIGSSAVAYAWFVWQKGFIGSPEIKWLNKTEKKEF